MKRLKAWIRRKEQEAKEIMRDRLQQEQDRKLANSRAYLKSKGKKNLHK
jgi:hypothetical protein